MKNIHPLNKIKLAGTVIGFVIVTLVIGIKHPAQVTANTNDNVHGYLFSDMPTASDQTVTPTSAYGGQGLGYVSLNNVSPDPVLPGTYGVNFDFQTGKFGGYGWSDFDGGSAGGNLGAWVDFAPTATTPSGSGTNAGPAYIDTACLATTGPCSVRGWIRYNQAGMSELGGWDGWVSLHGTASDGSVYGVMYDPTNGQLSGKAWGSDVVGWLDFSNAKIDTVPQTPVCTDPLATNYTAPPLQANQVSDASVCTYPIDICVTHPILCAPLSNFCKTHPALCAYVNHICTDSTASNYTAPPYTSNQVPDNAICLYGGCMNKCATNYDPTATMDDGSCIFPAVPKPFCVPGPGGPLKPIYKEN